MSYYLFLDDVRVPRSVTWVTLPSADWRIVRDYSHFVQCIKTYGVPEFVAYDHDLADSHYTDMNHGGDINYDRLEEKTGYDCAKFLVNECNKLGVPHPPYVVHSMNPIGAKNIISYIEQYNRICSK